MNFKLKNIIIGFAAASSFLFSSCSRKDTVDLIPEFNYDAITNPSSMDQVAQVLLGAYAGFRSNDYYRTVNTSGPWSVLPDMMADDLAETTENLPQDRAMTDWNYFPGTDRIQPLFNAAYVIIARTNIVLRDVDKFTTGLNTKLANRVKGQALAIRAHCHFDLLRYFGTSFDRNSTTDLALPYVTEFNFSASAKPARANNKDYYDKILADLASAATLLADIDRPINGSGNSRAFMDLAAIQAIQARVNLYAGQWAAAITAASAAITARPLVTIANAADYRGMYNETSAGEIIWNVQFDAGQGGPGGSLYFKPGNRNSFRPADAIANLSGTSGLIRNSDIRYAAFFEAVNNSGNVPRLTIKKYNGKGSQSDLVCNFPVYRTGEMYLIRAEAYAKSSQEALAMADLNFLRRNRINGYADEALTGATLLTAIADERRRELVAEGHRFFDLKRLGSSVRNINRGPNCGNNAIQPAGKCILAGTAREWSLPIPLNEMNTNPNMVQNPNY
ncbi:MAG: RagB/SusD family nutrient uptake outer membrane protein [Bacteroidota bacterium]|nr:RagB/SusD family nutrient uptake outer membrane protein [Bacteroidota bacterium]